MRRLGLAGSAFALLLLLGACAAREQPAGCDLEAGAEIAFTDTGAPDRVSARLLGPACDKTTALYVVSMADGHPIWSWAAPASQAFGVSFENEDEAEGFVNRWAAPALLRASALPAWAPGAPAPEGLHPAIERDTYEDIRARDLPVLCHLSGVGRESCVFWEPAAAAAALLLARDVGAAEPEEELP